MSEKYKVGVQIQPNVTTVISLFTFVIETSMPRPTLSLLVLVLLGTKILLHIYYYKYYLFWGRWQATWGPWIRRSGTLVSLSSGLNFQWEDIYFYELILIFVSVFYWDCVVLYAIP